VTAGSPWQKTPGTTIELVGLGLLLFTLKRRGTQLGWGELPDVRPHLSACALALQVFNHITAGDICPPATTSPAVASSSAGRTTPVTAGAKATVS
jgi:hypothetical protein